MWAQRRKWVIISILAAVAITIIALAGIATFYKAPSCTDNSQNQGEAGVDCGGPCPYLCTADEALPQALFTRQVSPAPGRTDVIAYVQNRNADAAVKGAPFTITLYGADNSIVASKSGTVDLPPGALVPVFVPDFYSGYQTVLNAFITFDGTSFKWYHDTDAPLVLPASNIVLTDTGQPRITADIGNPTARPLLRVPVVVTVFDSADNAIGASQTILDIPAMSSAQAVFTWNEPFAGTPVKEEVTPLAPLSPVGGF